MAHLRLLIVMTIAIFCYFPLVENATLHSKEQVQLEYEPESSVNKEEKKPFCDKQPCAWSIYNPVTRIFSSYVHNTCGCLDKSYKCIRTEDDLSTAAYVYHCRQNTTENDIVAPDEVY